MDEEESTAIAEFLKNGGTVTKIETGTITDPDDIVYKFKNRKRKKSA